MTQQYSILTRRQMDIVTMCQTLVRLRQVTPPDRRSWARAINSAIDDISRLMPRPIDHIDRAALVDELWVRFGLETLDHQERNAA
jgi:hypothetical protein